MEMIHVFLMGQHPLHLVNSFISRGQRKFAQEFSLSLRSLSEDKALHIGSFTAGSHGQIELKSRPPNLLKVTLKLVLTDQFLTLHVTLDTNEMLYHTIMPTKGLKLHHRPLEVTKYDRLQDRPVYSDFVMIKPKNIMLLGLIIKKISVHWSVLQTIIFCYFRWSVV